MTSHRAKMYNTVTSAVGCYSILWTATIVSASFSNIHFEFNDAVNFLNIDHPNQTKKIEAFAREIATRVSNEMVYDSKNRTMPCLPFNRTCQTKMLQPTRNFSFECHDGHIGHFRAVEVASPVSINQVEGAIFNASVLFRFRRFAMGYGNVTLHVEKEPPRHTSAIMTFSDDSYIRLNMSFNEDRVRSGRLLDISLPHYCVYSYEMPELPEGDSYLLQEMRPHLRHHFEKVESHRLIQFLYKFFKFIVETTWYGDISKDFVSGINQ